MMRTLKKNDRLLQAHAGNGNSPDSAKQVNSIDTSSMYLQNKLPARQNKYTYVPSKVGSYATGRQANPDLGGNNLLAIKNA